MATLTLGMIHCKLFSLKNSEGQSATVFCDKAIAMQLRIATMFVAAEMQHLISSKSLHSKARCIGHTNYRQLLTDADY